MTSAAAADPTAREVLRNADPVLARDAWPDFRPRAWLDELPRLDAFGTLTEAVRPRGATHREPSAGAR